MDNGPQVTSPVLPTKGLEWNLHFRKSCVESDFSKNIFVWIAEFGGGGGKGLNLRAEPPRIKLYRVPPESNMAAAYTGLSWIGLAYSHSRPSNEDHGGAYFF